MILTDNGKRLEFSHYLMHTFKDSEDGNPHTSAEGLPLWHVYLFCQELLREKPWLPVIDLPCEATEEQPDPPHYVAVVVDTPGSTRARVYVSGVTPVQIRLACHVTLAWAQGMMEQQAQAAQQPPEPPPNGGLAIPHKIVNIDDLLRRRGN